MASPVLHRLSRSLARSVHDTRPDGGSTDRLCSGHRLSRCSGHRSSRRSGHRSSGVPSRRPIPDAVGAQIGTSRGSICARTCFARSCRAQMALACIALHSTPILDSSTSVGECLKYVPTEQPWHGGGPNLGPESTMPMNTYWVSGVYRSSRARLAMSCHTRTRTHRTPTSTAV